MFNNKTKRLPLLGKMLKATGQSGEMNKPAFSSLGYRQGSQNLAPIPQGVERTDK